MPQLNPSPWLMILLFSWVILLTILQTKTLTTSFQSPPTTQNSTHKTPSWNWPWT